MSVEGTTERVLRMLALLQRRPSWTAAELATELGVTERSVRRDAERLRNLGYPVRATSGVGGGYRLGAGARMPPLLLDDEEAIATAVSLRMASGGTVSGAAQAALRALAKLDQVMPPRLREQVRAVHAATDTLVADGVAIDADVLVTFARACRDLLRVRFHYPTREGGEEERTVEPVRMVTTGRRWYLMAFDVDRDDWRTFRLDRMRDVHATTWRFAAREHPDPVEHVQRSVATVPYRWLARIRFHAPARTVRDLVPPTIGLVHDEGTHCVLEVGGEDLDWIAAHVARLGLPAEVLEPPELREAAARLARTLLDLGGNRHGSARAATVTPVNPYVTFALLRVGFLVLPLAVLTLLGIRPPLSIAIALVLSVVLSAVFLRDQRRRIADRITARAQRRTR